MYLTFDYNVYPIIFFIIIKNNYFNLDGDLGAFGRSKAAYMKQKHRMIWERRHGPVGSGMKGGEEEEHH